MRTCLAACLFAAALLSFAPAAFAVDMDAGDSCTDFVAGDYRPTGGRNNPDGALVVCDGAIWQPILRYSSVGNRVMFASTGLAAAPLHVWGEAIIGSQGLSCNNATEGAIRYQSGSNVMELCDGSSWLSVNTGAGGHWLDGVSPDDIHYSDGNVGIGVTDPADFLHIGDGNIRIDGTSGNQAGCLRFNDATDKLEFSDDCSTFASFASASTETSDAALVALGTGTASATSFNLDPDGLGASDGDTMVVAAAWEDDAAVTSPGGWTELVDYEHPSGGVTGRVTVDYIRFSGAPPSSVTWSYAGGSGVAYSWAILSGVEDGDISSASSYVDGNGGTGTTEFDVPGAVGGTLVFAVGDGSSQTGETASLGGGIFTSTDQNNDVAGFAALAGYANQTGTASYALSQFQQNSFDNLIIPIGPVDRTVLFSENGTITGDQGFVFSSSGNVGIGEKAPTAKIHMGSDHGSGNYFMKMKPTDDQAGYIAAYADDGSLALSLWQSWGGGMLSIYNNGTERVTLSNWSSSDPHILVFADASDTGGDDGAAVQIHTPGDGENGIFFSDASCAGGCGAPDAGILADLAGSTGILKFKTDDGSSGLAEKMRITGGGSVGIGTDSPAAPLHVAGEIIFSSSGLACTAAAKGGLRWSDATGTIETCDGTDWLAVSTDTAPADPVAVVGIGAETAAATSLNLDPQALGASVGDTMIVASVWEDDSAVTSPGGWTNLISMEAPMTNSASRLIVDTITFSGSVPSSVTWSYGGTSGISYGWTILSNVETPTSATTFEDGNISTGLVSTTAAAGTGGVAVFALADGVSEAGEGMIFSGTDQAIRDTTPAAGFAATTGYKATSGTVEFTTTAIVRASVQGITVPIACTACGGSEEVAGADGQVQFNSGGGAFGASTNFVWDNTNGRLGVGTAAPSKTLDLKASESWININSTSSTDAGIDFQINGVTKGRIIYGEGVAANVAIEGPGTGDTLTIGQDATRGDYRFEVVSGETRTIMFRNNGGWNAARIDVFKENAGNSRGTMHLRTGAVADQLFLDADGNVGIGTTGPAATLDVNGFAKLKLNSAAPATCNATYYGSVALTSTGTICTCTTAGAWRQPDGTTACAW